MVINSQIERHSKTLVNEDKLYSMKPQRFEKYAVELMYRTVVAIQSPHQPLYEGLEMRHNHITTYGKHKDRKRRYQALPLVLYLSTVTKKLKLINTEWQEKIFNRTYQDVDNVADALKMKQQK